MADDIRQISLKHSDFNKLSWRETFLTLEMLAVILQRDLMQAKIILVYDDVTPVIVTECVISNSRGAFNSTRFSLLSVDYETLRKQILDFIVTSFHSDFGPWWQWRSYDSFGHSEEWRDRYPGLPSSHSDLTVTNEDWCNSEPVFSDGVVARRKTNPAWSLSGLDVYWNLELDTASSKKPSFSHKGGLPPEFKAVEKVLPDNEALRRKWNGLCTEYKRFLEREESQNQDRSL